MSNQAARRAHTKSRRGCLNCKRRHAKVRGRRYSEGKAGREAEKGADLQCNEQRPACARCQRLSDACLWPAAVHPQTFPSGTSDVSTPESLPWLRDEAPRQSAEGARQPSVTDGLMAALSSLYHGPQAGRGAGPGSGRVAGGTAPGLPFEFDLLDLRLLHHYMLHVHAALDPAATPAQQRIWQDTVLRLGFDHPFLLRGVLALSALHLMLEVPRALATDARTMTALPLRAAAHVDSALATFRARLGKDGQLQSRPGVAGSTGTVDGGDGAPSAVFVFSCLLVVHSFANAKALGTIRTPLQASSGFGPGSRPGTLHEPNTPSSSNADNKDVHDAHDDDPISALVASFRLVRGVSTLLQPHFLHILTSEVAPLVANALPPSPMTGLAGSVAQDVPALLQLHQWISKAPPSNSIDDNDDNDDNDDDNDDNEDTSIDADAVAELHRVVATVHAQASRHEQGSLLALMLVWPVIISDAFLDRLARRRPRSLLVLAHFATLFNAGATCWWITGWDRAIVEAVEAELCRAGHGDGSTLLSWLAWPKAEISRALDRGTPVHA